ncbi:hypothetical protein [Streptomyces sp. H62]
MALFGGSIALGVAAAPPAAAGGVGDFLSPAFGTACGNHGGPHAAGSTSHGTGTVGGNLAGLPIGSPLNQCGGADLALPAVSDVNACWVSDLTAADAIDVSKLPVVSAVDLSTFPVATSAYRVVSGLDTSLPACSAASRVI